jgi:putative ABC transport system permease protein
MIIWEDLRFGIRMLLKNPLFTCIALFTLALGIGANTATFSVVNTVLLRPLPFPNSDRLVAIEGFDPRTGAEKSYSYTRYTELRKTNQSYESIAAIANDSPNLTGRDIPELVRGAKVSGDFFQTLDVKALLGRTFLPEEDQTGGPLVAILSYSLWQRRFGGDPTIVGRAIELDGNSVTVVGVLPADFKYLDEKREIWLPRVFEVSYMSPESIRRGAFYLRIIGRLKPTVGFQQAQAELATLSKNYNQSYPDNSDVSIGPRILPLQEYLVGNSRKSLMVVLATVSLILLIACANVANLLLGRASARRQEFAVRLAMGATKSRLGRQLLTESVLLSLLGGLLGLLISYLSIRALAASPPSSIPRLEEVNLDWRVLGFTLGVSLLTGILFGLAPAMNSVKGDLHQTLREAGRTGESGPRGHRTQRLLVIAEIALTLILLIDAGLLIKSFQRLHASKVGLKYDSVLTMRLTLPKARFQTPIQQASFHNQLLQRIATLPGVEDVAASSSLPLDGAPGGGFVFIEGIPSLGPGKDPIIPTRFVTPRYLSALGIPLVSGRNFAEQDDEKAPNVVLINQKMARRFWPDEDPVGKYLAYSTSKIRCQVVGVVGNTKFKVSDTDISEEMLAPLAQKPRPTVNLLVRTSIEPTSLVSTVQREILNIDKDQPVTAVRTLEQVVGESIEQPRLTMLLLGGFALAALLLAIVGVYGVMNYSVTRRTADLGVRIALGAQRRDILALVIKQGMMLTLIGVVVGLIVVTASSRLLSTMLFEVSAINPLLFISISLLFGAISFMACYIPARRATRIDPIIALRNQ